MTKKVVSNWLNLVQLYKKLKFCVLRGVKKSRLLLYVFIPNYRTKVAELANYDKK